MVRGKKRTEDDESEEEYNFYDYIDYFMGGIPKMRGLVDDLLDYESLTDFMQYSIITEEKKIKDKIQKLSEEDRFFEDEYYDNTLFNYKRLMYSSMFLSIHTIFEGRIKLLCELTDTYKPAASKLLKLNGEDTIERCISYLKKRMPIAVIPLSKHTKFRQSCQALRNCLVHKSLLINSKIENANFDKLKQNVNIKLSPTSHLNTTGVYYAITVKYQKLITEYLKVIRELFEEFAKALKSLI